MFAWYQQICNGCFNQVSEWWPMGRLFVVVVVVFVIVVVVATAAVLVVCLFVFVVVVVFLFVCFFFRKYRIVSVRFSNGVPTVIQKPCLL